MNLKIMKNKSSFVFVPTVEEIFANDSTKYGHKKEFSKFVGVRYESIKSDDGIEHRIFIHYPRTLSLNNDTPKNRLLIKELLHSVKLSKNTSEKTNYYNNKINNIEVKSNFPLYSYLWIWDDFKKNGRILSSDSKDVLNGSGKINWKKVFDTNSFYDGNNIYYTDMICKEKIIMEDMITEVYDYCVYRSLEMILFITNLKCNIIHPIYKNLSNGLKQKYLSVINNALENTFDDEKKLRYINMKRILSSVSSNEMNEAIIYGVDKYHPVFEKIIDLALGNNDASNFYPSAYSSTAKLYDEDEDGVVSKLRPDTINICDDTLFIFDSKFYESGSMPSAESVEKQIVYGEFAEIRKKFKSDNIFNVFILPPNKNNLNDFKNNEKIKYEGYLYSDWKKNDKNYEIILVYRINFEYLIMNYKNYNEDLFSEIKKDVLSRFKNGDLLNDIKCKINSDCN